MHKPKCPPGHAFALKLEAGATEWKLVPYPTKEGWFSFQDLKLMVGGVPEPIQMSRLFTLMVDRDGAAKGLPRTTSVSVNGGPPQALHGPVLMLRIPYPVGSDPAELMPSGLRPEDVDRFLSLQGTTKHPA